MAADRNMRGGELRPDTRKDARLGPEWRLEVSQLAANGIAAKVPHVWCGIHYRHRPLCTRVRRCSHGAAYRADPSAVPALLFPAFAAWAEQELHDQRDNVKRSMRAGIVVVDYVCVYRVSLNYH